MKKVFLVIVLSCMTLCLSGCSKNGSAESVAKEMVKRLSEENYNKIGELFYQDENSYFDEKVFKELLEKEQLTIPGNKKIEIKEVGSEITNEDGNITVKVKVSIDNGKIYNIDTIEIDGKWYVYEPDFYDYPMIIAVPEWAKVKLNGKKLSEDYKETRTFDLTVDHPNISSYSDYKMQDVEMSVYVIENALEGKYDITVETDKEVKDVIYTYSYRSEAGSTNYEYDYEYGEYIYYLFGETKDISESYKTFVNNYLGNIYANAVNTRSFDGVKNYFDEESEKYSKIKKEYEAAITKYGDKNSQTLPNTYYDNFSIENVEYHSVNEYSNGLIAICVTYKVNYQYHKRYSTTILNSDSDKTNTVSLVLILRKSTDGSYKIVDGINLFIK